jgi:hypothetical protein
MTHTPGPWRYEPLVNGEGELLHDYIVDSEGRILADVIDPKDGPVIAEAPKLLQYLETALAIIEMSNGLWMGADAARATIARARAPR